MRTRLRRNVHHTGNCILPARVSSCIVRSREFADQVPRTYLVSTPIVALYYTELVGDAKVLPTLKAAAGFSGIAVIDADPYLSGGANMYVNQVGDTFSLSLLRRANWAV